MWFRYISYLCPLLLLLWMFVGSSAECNVCSPVTKQACVTNDQYKLCNSSYMPVGQATQCPTGQKCSFNGDCQDAAQVPVASCQDCGECSATKTHACLDTKSFALCLGTDEPKLIIGTCAPDHVCNVNDQFICGSAAEGATPTCSFANDPTTTTTTTTTTPSPINTPTDFCTVMGVEGRYPVGTDPTTTCKQYVHCYKLTDGSWIGARYQCPGETYYDSTSKNCIKTLPGNCGARRFSLAVNGVAWE